MSSHSITKYFQNIPQTATSTRKQAWRTHHSLGDQNPEEKSVPDTFSPFHPGLKILNSTWNSHLNLEDLLSKESKRAKKKQHFKPCSRGNLVLKLKFQDQRMNVSKCTLCFGDLRDCNSKKIFLGPRIETFKRTNASCSSPENPRVNKEKETRGFFHPKLFKHLNFQS